MVKISVIVPICNVEKYLSACLDSILGQTLREIEIICINDGSTDSCGEILDKYAAKDSRIKAIHQKNSGYGKAMNVGLDAASGKYISIIESDDTVELNMLEKLFDAAEKSEADWVKASFWDCFYDENGDFQAKFKAHCKKEDFGKVFCPRDDFSVLVGCIAHWSGIYSRDFLVKNDIRFQETPGASFQDAGFYLQTLFLAQRAVFVEDAFYHYRINNASSSVNTLFQTEQKVFATFSEYEFAKEKLKMHPEIWEEVKEYWAYRMFDANAFWVVHRVAPQMRRAFVEKFATAWENAHKEKEIDESFFTKSQMRDIAKILKEHSPKNADKCQSAKPKFTSPMLSVIVPCYNVEKYVDQCLKSLLTQSVQNLRIIAIDDGSTDGTLEILQRIERENAAAVRVLSQKNKGLGAARNACLKFVDTPYVTFLDSDDWQNERFVEEFERLLFAHKQELDMVFTLPVCFNNKKQIYEDWMDKPLFERLFFGSSSASTNIQNSPELFMLEENACRKIYRTAFLKELGFTFPEGVKWEDFAGHFWTLHRARRICGMRLGFYYRTNTGKQITSLKDRSRLDAVKVFADAFALAKSEKFSKIERAWLLCHTLKTMLWHVCVIDEEWIFELLDGLHGVFAEISQDDVEFYVEYVSATKHLDSLILKILRGENYREMANFREDLARIRSDFAWYESEIQRIRDAKVCFEKPKPKSKKDVLMQILRSIFSVKNEYSGGVKRKVVCFFGVKFKIRCKDRRDKFKGTSKKPFK